MIVETAVHNHQTTKIHLRVSPTDRPAPLLLLFLEGHRRHLHQIMVQDLLHPQATDRYLTVTAIADVIMGLIMDLTTVPHLTTMTHSAVTSLSGDQVDLAGMVDLGVDMAATEVPSVVGVADGVDEVVDVVEAVAVATPGVVMVKTSI